MFLSVLLGHVTLLFLIWSLIGSGKMYYCIFNYWFRAFYFGCLFRKSNHSVIEMLNSIPQICLLKCLISQFCFLKVCIYCSKFFYWFKCHFCLCHLNNIFSLCFAMIINKKFCLKNSISVIINKEFFILFILAFSYLKGQWLLHVFERDSNHFLNSVWFPAVAFFQN